MELSLENLMLDARQYAKKNKGDIMCRLVLCIATILCAACSEPAPEHWHGAYRLSDGRLVSLRESTPETLRLRVFDSGETRRYVRGDDGGWHAGPELHPDALSASSLTVEEGTLTLSYANETAITGTRIDLPVIEHDLEVNGARLHVRLTLPSGGGPHPAIVLAHGSGDDAATRTYGTADFFPAHGVASVVYDKRGTGRSSGTYNMDFHQLANDLVEVAQWVAEQPGIDPTRIGVTGYSQGSWIGPLAASRSDRFSFVIASYGMIDSPRRELRLEAEERLRRRGHDEHAVREAGTLADAAVDVMVSDYRDWTRFDRLAEQFRDRAWMGDLDYPMTELLRWPQWIVRIAAGFVAAPGLPWDYTSVPALDGLAEKGIPSVWLIASHDRSAPNAFTLAELARRVDAGEPVEVAVLSPTDHGFLLFEENAAGERRYGNHHPDYFRTEVDYARRLSGLASGEARSSRLPSAPARGGEAGPAELP